MSKTLLKPILLKVGHIIKQYGGYGEWQFTIKFPVLTAADVKD
jgi:hypothetical protein